MSRHGLSQLNHLWSSAAISHKKNDRRIAQTFSFTERRNPSPTVRRRRVVVHFLQSLTTPHMRSIFSIRN